MSYITNADIELRVGAAAYAQLADDDGDAVADEAVINEVRLSAEAEVNSYLARRYAVPVDVSGDPELAGLLAAVTLDIAEFRLRARRPPVAEDVRRRHEQTLAWLMRIAAGVVQMPALAAVAGPTAGGMIARSVGEPRLLSRDELREN